MKTFLALAAAALVAGTAVAQMPPPPPPGAPMAWDRDAFWRGAPESPRERMDFLQMRIDRGMSDGSLDRREARNAQRDLNNIRMWARNMRMVDGHLTPGDRDALQARLDGLSGRLHWMRHNGW